MMRSSTLGFALYALMAGCAGRALENVEQKSAGFGRGSKSAAELALASSVSDQRAARRVRELVALGPRMGGTASGKRASAYLARAFEELGLVVRSVEDSELWCHAESGWQLEARVLGGDAQVLEFPLASAWPYGFSPAATGSAELALEPGPGAAWLTQRYRPGQLAPDAHPVLCLVDGRTTADGSYPVVEHLGGGGAAPFPVFGLSRPDGERLRAELDELDEGHRVELRYELSSEVRRARPRTVIASLPARKGAAPGYFLFCAHGDSDSGGPGANDNASGEAILLEIASAWTRAIYEDRAPAPAREVRFAIWGSEIHSSEDYLRRRVPGEGRLLGVLNYDQAGFGSGSEQLNIEPDDLPANRALVHEVLGVLEDFEGAPGFPQRWATNKSLGGTDSYVFSDAEIFKAGGLPSLTLFTSAWGRPNEHPRTPDMPGESWRERDKVSVDYDQYYHSAGDLPENTTDREPHNMGWCARVGMIAVARFLE